MNRFRPFTIKDFDYGGEADQELYDMYAEQVARKLSGYNAKDILASANRKKSKMKYNDFVFTTDIANADWEWVRRNFIVGFLRAGWGGYSIESSYFWEDDSRGLHFSRNLPEDVAETPLLNLVLAGEVF